MSRMRLPAAFLLAFTLSAAAGTAAVAQDDLNCDDFEFQEDAQQVYDQDTSDPNGLDGDDQDGLACESLPSRGSDDDTSADDGDVDDDSDADADGDDGDADDSGDDEVTMPTGGVAAGGGGTAPTTTNPGGALLGLVAAAGAFGAGALALRERRVH